MMQVLRQMADGLANFGSNGNRDELVRTEFEVSYSSNVTLVLTDFRTRLT